MKKTTVKVFLVSPRGMLPQLMKVGEDVGYDVPVCSIVLEQMDDQHPYRRKVLWDFIGQPHSSLQGRLGHAWVKGSLQSAYMLQPMESIRLGTGFALGMMRDVCAELQPRSSNSHHEIILMNGMEPKLGNLLNFHNYVPWDPGFKGEGIMKVKNMGNSPIPITHGMKLSQLVFRPEGGKGFLRPAIQQVHSLNELGTSIRGTRSHGSSGTHFV